MDLTMATKPVLPGIRFHPTDEELFMYYLKRKVTGRRFHQIMAEVDVYKFAPWDLPPMSCLKTKDRNWYFFCPRSKKFSSGSRANRATEDGFWKSTGNDRTVEYQGRVVGKIKTLVFYRGKPHKGERTDWIMYEYRLEDPMLADQGVAQDSFVICKIYQKSGPGPKNGEHYGAPFVEEEWESNDDNNNVEANPNPDHNPSPESVLHQEDDNNNVKPPEDDLDRMLAVFDADDNASPTDAAAAPTDGTTKEANNDDCFDGLEDLKVPQSSDVSDSWSWSQIVAMIDLARQNNLYIEVDDFLL